MNMNKPIGGFFGLELPFTPTEYNLFKLWKSEDSLLFHNGRSALAYALKSTKGSDIFWVPAYITPSMPQAGKYVGKTVRFYPITEDLSPDLKFLNDNIKLNDFVLVVDYYGRPQKQEVVDFAKKRSDITWIEDRVQAIFPSDSYDDPKYWADFAFYSPRKHLGVPDGGILIDLNKTLPEPQYESINSAQFIEASLMRYEDKKERNNELWYKIFTTNEKDIKPNMQSMSRIAYDIMQASDFRPILEKRKQNFQVLYEALKDISYFEHDKLDFIPFGLLVNLGEKRDNIAVYLAKNKIFAPRYWPDLPSPEKEFPFEYKLAVTTLMLPCDYRYGEEEMQRIISVISEVL